MCGRWLCFGAQRGLLGRKIPVLVLSEVESLCFSFPHHGMPCDKGYKEVVCCVPVGSFFCISHLFCRSLHPLEAQTTLAEQYPTFYCRFNQQSPKSHIHKQTCSQDYLSSSRLLPSSSTSPPLFLTSAGTLVPQEASLTQPAASPSLPDSLHPLADSPSLPDSLQVGSLAMLLLPPATLPSPLRRDSRVLVKAASPVSGGAAGVATGAATGALVLLPLLSSLSLLATLLSLLAHGILLVPALGATPLALLPPCLLLLATKRCSAAMANDQK